MKSDMHRNRPIVDLNHAESVTPIDEISIVEEQIKDAEEVEYSFYYDGISQLHKRAVKWEMERL